MRPLQLQEILNSQALALLPQESKPSFSLGRHFNFFWEAALVCTDVTQSCLLKVCLLTLCLGNLTGTAKMVYRDPKPFASSWFVVLFF